MKRSRVIVILSAVVVLAGLVWAVVGPREPAYHGRTVTEWAYRLVDTYGTRGQNECTDALRVFGTNAVPALLRLVAARDGTVKSRFIQFVNGRKRLHVHIHDDEDKHFRAALAFLFLGTDGLPAVPELMRLRKGRDDQVAEAAYDSLRSIRGDEGLRLILVNDLLNDLPESNPSVRSRAAAYMRQHWEVQKLLLNIMTQTNATAGAVYP